LSLLKGVLRFVLLTLAICLLGGMIGSVGALAGKPPGLTALGILGMVIVVLSPFLSAAWLWRRRRKAKAQEAAMRLTALAEEQDYQENLLRRRLIERQRLIDAVDQHRGALERNLARAVRTNDYGTVVQDTRGEALAEFFASIAPDGALFSFEDAKALVFEQLNTRRREQVAAGFDAGSVPLDGHEFEHWVADALKRYGWKATRGSGDQGLDVIAEKKGKRVGLQCKLYGGPVGNKAVQEAHAGKVYYGVDAVGVLTNASFTPSATALAAVTGVKLFSQHDIPSLFEKTFAAR
jgi:restriction system protein